MGKFKGRKIQGVILFCFVLSALYSSPVKAIRNNPFTLAPISKPSYTPFYKANKAETHPIEELLAPSFPLEAAKFPQILPVTATLAVGAPNSQTFISSGSFTPPAGVTSITVEAWGGGGGGATASGAAGGGGGGAYTKGTLTSLAPGISIPVVVGLGGSAGAAGASSFIEQTNSGGTVIGTVRANGGSAGINRNGGAGGAASAIGGNIIASYAGGLGGHAANINGGADNEGGGGGGGSATTTAVGNNGGNGTSLEGGSGGTGTGNGGDGADGKGASEAFMGMAPGGGGGGRGESDLTISEAGGNGLVIISWGCPVYQITDISLLSSICEDKSTTITVTSSAAADLPVGGYVVEYTLSGTNSGSGNATLTVNTPGTGTFPITFLNGGTTTITITRLSSGGATQICSSEISGQSKTVNISCAPLITDQPVTPIPSGDGTQTLSVTAQDAESYVWKKNGNIVVDDEVISGQGTATLTLTKPTADYVGSYVVEIQGSCASVTSDAVNVTVSTLPASAGPITGTATVCQGSAGYTYSVPVIANATGYVWSLPGGATITNGDNTNSITVAYSTSAVSGNITVYGKNADGDGAASNYEVTVNPLPASAGTITGDATICQGENSVSYSVPAIANATNYIWNLPGGATITNGENTNSITVDYSLSAVSGNITVQGTNACGNGALSANYGVTVNPLPASADLIAGDATVCQGENGVTYSVPAIANATGYVWTLPGGATITNGANTNSITVNYSSTAISGSMTVQGTNACGNGALSANYEVTVNPLPASAGTITGDATVCQGENGVIYSVPPIANATSYNWTLPSGASIIGSANTRSITINYSSTAVSGNITVQGANACGNGIISGNFLVTVNQIPTATATPSSQLICSGTTISPIVFTGAVSGTTYNWTRTNGADVTGIPINGSGDIIGSLINNTTIQQTVKFIITPIANGCTGTPIEATVEVYPKLSSVISVNGNSSICSGNSTEVWITFTGSGPFKYTLNNGPEVTATGNPEKLTVSPTTNTTYILTSLSGSNDCTAQASDRTGSAIVTVLPLPALTSPLVTSACSGNTFSYTPGMSIPGSTYKWVRAAVTGISNSSAEGTGSINEILTNTTNAPIDVVYRFELTSPNPQACTSIQNVVVTVNPMPGFTASADQERTCVGTPITISANPGSVSGYTYSLTYIPDGSNIYSTIPTFENNAIGSFVVYPIVGKHTYRLTATNSQGCSISKEIQVKVFDKPVISISPSCSEQSVTMTGTMIGTSSNPSNFTGSDLGVIEYSYDNGATWRTTTYWGPNLPLGVFAVLARNSVATDIYPTCTTSISANITLTSVLTENVSVCQGLPAPSFSAVALCSGWGKSDQINNLNPPASSTYWVSNSVNPPYSQGALVAYMTTGIFTVDKNNPQITFDDCNNKKGSNFSYSIYEYPFNATNPSDGFVTMVTACPKVTISLNPNKYYQLVINDYDVNSNDESSIKFNGNDRIQVLNNTTEIVSWYKADGTFIQSSNSFNPVPSIIPNTDTPGNWKFYAACGSSSCRQEVNFTINPIPTGSAAGSNLVVTCSSQETSIQLKSVDLFGIPVPAGSVSYTWTTSIAAQDPSKVTITNNTCTSGCSEIIRETVTNSGTTTAIVDFTITPKGGDCVGQDFHVYLSVEPMPDFKINNTNVTICPSANPQIIPIEVVSLNSNLITGLQYIWNRTNTTNLPATPDGSVPASGIGNANGFTISGTLESLFPKSLQTTLFTVEAQVNVHTCVTKTTSVTIGDEIAPVITCPAASLSFDCISKLPTAATDYTSFVALGGTATDNCTSPPIVTHVGDVIQNGTNCNGIIRRTYRARDYAGNYSECYQDITIVNNTLPAFTIKPPATFDRCVYDITDAIFDPLTEDLKPNIDLSPARPDYYRLTPDDKAALSNIAHSGQCNVTLHWKIVDSNGNAIRDENSDLLQDKTDALSLHPIKLNGAQTTDVAYRLIYWLVDGCGNKAAEDQVIITIKPRPLITKMTN